MQFNHIKDYLNKGDADVFSKSIVPFLRLDNYIETGEMEPSSLAMLLHTCIINWQENYTTTQEMVLDSLEDAIDKYGHFPQILYHYSVSLQLFWIPSGLVGSDP